MTLSFFGIRHHGPGSARSLERALARLNPDLILVEGPPEAESALKSILDPDMLPPVALLAHDPKSAHRASFYPFAQFSPEWRAFRYALESDIELRLMDLPVAHKFGLLAAQERADNEVEVSRKEIVSAEKREEDKAGLADEPQSETQRASESLSLNLDPQREFQRFWREAILRDPLSYFGQLAGYGDGEGWWEKQVELGQRDDQSLFMAVAEMMTALRESLGGWAYREDMSESERHEFRREASMRKIIKKAKRDHFERIAVVCGAWHVPALINPPPLAQDRRALKDLPKSKVVVTWIPWTYGRLSAESGYGAGVISPGWYDHLWESGATQGALWLSKVARALRDEGLDISSAHIIESHRLAEALASLRDFPVPRLEELNEAICAVMLFGDHRALKLIKSKLMISERVGEIPSSLPATPLQRDLQQLQKRLRLKPSPERQEKTFDLRKPLDLERSQLIHRLKLLELPWGELGYSSGDGTFKEHWLLEWRPEFALELIDRARWGQTVESATIAYASHQAQSLTLSELTEHIKFAITADLSPLVSVTLNLLHHRASVSSDMTQLLNTISPLADLAHYSDVRGSRIEVVDEVINSITPRVSIGLFHACLSLNETSAAQMSEQIEKATISLQRLERKELLDQWFESLLSLSQRDSLQGYLLGSLCRLLVNADLLSDTESAHRMSLALSRSVSPTQSAAWLEGFLNGSGLILIYDDELWTLVDQWVYGLSEDHFIDLLPLIRRTFSSFTPAELRQLGSKLSRNSFLSSLSQESEDVELIDHERAASALPFLERMLRQ